MPCPTPQNCVKKCPDQTISFYSTAAKVQKPYSMKQYCLSEMSDSDFQTKSTHQLVKEQLCPPWIIQSQPFLGRCLPSINTTNDNTTIIHSYETLDKKDVKVINLKMALYNLGAFLNVRNFVELVFSNIKESWVMIGIGLLLATILSYFWIILMRFMACIMIWLSIGLIFVLFGGLFGYSLYRYLYDSTDDISFLEVNFTPDYLFHLHGLKDTWLVYMCIFGIIFVIIFLVLLILRQRIQIAIKLIGQGAKAVGQMCSTTYFPIVPFILHVVVVLWFATLALYLLSSGTKIYRIYYDDVANQQNQSIASPPNHCLQDNNCINPATTYAYKKYEQCDPNKFNESCHDCPEMTCQFNKYEKQGQHWLFSNWKNWYNLFGFLWAMEFVTAFGEMVLAGICIFKLTR